MTMYDKVARLTGIFLLAFIFLSMKPALAQEATPGRPSTGEQYVPQTFTVDVDSSLYTNPFDPSDIEAALRDSCSVSVE